MTSEVWTPETVATLKRLRQEGLSTREIAHQLGPQFTRNMVIGKALRMGFKTPNPGPKMKKDTVNHKLWKPRKKAKKPLPEQKPVTAGKPFSEVASDGTCQYCLGGDLYCGADVHDNQYKLPYCANHLLVIYDKSGARRVGDYQKRVLRELQYRSKGATSLIKNEIARFVTSELGS